jgi:hypothetical protein
MRKVRNNERRCLYALQIAALLICLVSQACQDKDGRGQPVPKDNAETLLVSDNAKHIRVFAKPVAPDKMSIRIEGAPKNVRCFPMAPDAREPELRRGTWLILNFAIASVPDARSVVTAVRCANRLGQTVSVGVRPFSSYDELKSWCPQYVRPSAESPLWIVMKDGEILGDLSGVQTEDTLLAFVKKVTTDQ